MHICRITINGVPRTWNDTDSITYEAVCRICARNPKSVPTVSVVYPHTHRDRSLMAGESAPVISGTVINCYVTNNA